jgi:hypothetical protein
LEEAFFLFFLCYQTMVLFTGFGTWRAHRNAACARPRHDANLDTGQLEGK